MRFTKMHGAGNDYVYIDCLDNPFPNNPAEIARSVSDRHFGIGGDGMIAICPSDVADVRMRIFNSDGSEAEMCGNGVRCVAKYVYDHDLVKKEKLRVETGAGVLSLELEVEKGLARRVRVDMGEPILEAKDIPTTLPGSPVVQQNLSIAGRSFEVTCVSMGNPHCVTFVDKLSDELLLRFGSAIENDSHFPNRTNVEFVEVISPEEISMRVWERGSGETLACGTGACAVCVAGVLENRTNREITAHLRGGNLKLEWAENNHVYMTGPAVEVFSGQWQQNIE